jgi:hypothetical protein
MVVNARSGVNHRAAALAGTQDRARSKTVIV